MQPLARSHISRAFIWPTVLLTPRPEGEVCSYANRCKRKRSVEWKTYVKTKEKLKFRFASPQNQESMPEIHLSVSTTYRQRTVLFRPGKIPGIRMLIAKLKGEAKPERSSPLKWLPPRSIPDGSIKDSSAWFYGKSESVFPEFLLL